LIVIDDLEKQLLKNGKCAITVIDLCHLAAATRQMLALWKKGLLKKHRKKLATALEHAEKILFTQ
jgi:hypothetical protein